MNPIEQIEVLQRMIREAEAHILQLVQENADLRARVEIPRSMQQEANLLAMENAEGFLKDHVVLLKEQMAQITEAARLRRLRDDDRVSELDDLLAALLEDDAWSD